MDKIQIVEMGFYHPSTANWSYGIHLIIDSTGARLYRETFGGDERAKHTLENLGFQVEKISAGKGSSVQYKWRDIKDLHDIENYQGINWGEKSLDR